MPAIRIVETIPDLGTVLKERRLERDIDKRRLAAVIALSSRTVTDVENGDVDPKLSIVKRLAEALGYRLALVPLNAAQHVSEFELPVGASEPEAIDDWENSDYIWQGDGQ